MAAVIKRIAPYTYLQSVHTPDYPENDWLRNPDLSVVVSVAQKYWKVAGDNVVEMTQGEKDAVDAALLEDQVDRIIHQITSPIDTFRVFDDFTGPTVNWYKFAQDKVGASSLVQAQAADWGQVLIRSGPAEGNYATLTTGEYSFRAAHNLSMQTGFRLAQTANLLAYVGFWRDWSNKVEFRATDGYWHTTCSAGGNHTVTQSAIELDTDWHSFEIEMSSLKATFKIDKVLVQEHYENIPTDLMYFRAQIARAAGAAALDAYFDFVSIDGQRVYSP